MLDPLPNGIGISYLGPLPSIVEYHYIFKGRSYCIISNQMDKDEDKKEKEKGNISRDLRMIVGWISALKNTVRPSLQSLHLSPPGPLTLFFPLLPCKQPQQ
jgi:hypothetical protein